MALHPNDAAHSGQCVRFSRVARVLCKGGVATRIRRRPAWLKHLCLCRLTNSFPRTRAEREASGDPRLSLEERYGSRKAYLRAARSACDELVAKRLLLEEDVDRVMEEAAAMELGLPEG